MKRFHALPLLMLCACTGDTGIPSLAVACPDLSDAPAFCASGSRMAMFERDDLSGTVRISARPGLTGVGPIQGLQGEITVYDGELFLSSLDGNGAEVRLAQDAAPAIFFAGGTASQWVEIRSDRTLDGLDAVEGFVRARAVEAGLDLDTPFAFRIEGTAAQLGYHVIFKSDPEARPHSMALHKQAKIPFRADGDRVRIAGVWADRAGVGRYTHPGRHTHLHAVTSDGRSGHVDAIALESGAVLFLPASKESLAE